MTFILTVPSFLKTEMQRHFKNHSMVNSVVDCNIENEIHLNLKKEFTNATAGELFHAAVNIVDYITYEAFLGQHSNIGNSQDEILELLSLMEPPLGNCFFRRLTVCEIFPSVKSMKILLELGLTNEEALILILYNKHSNDPMQQEQLKTLFELIFSEGKKAEIVDHLYRNNPHLVESSMKHPTLGPILKAAENSNLEKYARFLDYVPKNIEYHPVALKIMENILVRRDYLTKDIQDADNIDQKITMEQCNRKIVDALNDIINTSPFCATILKYTTTYGAENAFRNHNYRNIYIDSDPVTAKFAGHYDAFNNIYLRLRDNPGTLIHELFHKAMNMRYRNGSNPYSKNDLATKDKINEIIELELEVLANDEQMLNWLNVISYLDYDRNTYDAELFSYWVYYRTDNIRGKWAPPGVSKESGHKLWNILENIVREMAEEMGDVFIPEPMPEYFIISPENEEIIERNHSECMGKFFDTLCEFYMN